MARDRCDGSLNNPFLHGPLHARLGLNGFHSAFGRPLVRPPSPSRSQTRTKYPHHYSSNAYDGDVRGGHGVGDGAQLSLPASSLNDPRSSGQQAPHHSACHNSALYGVYRNTHLCHSIDQRVRSDGSINHLGKDCLPGCRLAGMKVDFAHVYCPNQGQKFVLNAMLRLDRVPYHGQVPF